MGVSGVDRISNFYEWNVEQGGPIVKNKLCSTARSARLATIGPSPTRSSSRPARPTSLPHSRPASRTPVAAEQGISDEKMDNPIVRLTWQMTDRNKLALWRPCAAPPRACPGCADDQTTGRRWSGTRRGSAPGRRSGPRPCRRSCCSRTASRSTASATTSIEGIRRATAAW